MKRLKIVFFILIVLFTLDVAKDLFFRSLLAGHLTQVTGLKTTIGALHASLFRSNLHAKEILLYNPENFEDRRFIWISDCFIDVDPLAFFKGRYHFRKMRIVVEELFIIKNQDGSTNMNTLRTGSLFPVQVDTLDLTILKIINKDNTVPIVYERDSIIRNERFENLQNLGEIIQTIIFSWKNSPLF